MEDRLARLLGQHGLIEARFDHCVQALGDEEITRGRSTLEEKGHVTDPKEALAFFSSYTFPATRQLLFPVADGWTAALNNSKNGSDFREYQDGWCRAVRARTLRVVDQDPVVRKRVVLAYEARIVELYDASARIVRIVTCMNDGGRWAWHVSGDPLPVEAGFPFDARKVKDRFTRSHLRTWIHSLGAPAVDAAAFLNCRSFSLVEETYKNADWMARIRAKACTEEELLEPAHGFYERGLTWMDNLETHATSAITDFERALEINPAYESRVRPHLDRAYRFVRGK